MTIAVRFGVVLALAAGCAGDPNAPDVTGHRFDGIVSEPTAGTAGAFGAGAVRTAVSRLDAVAWVSAAPGTIPGGTSTTIVNSRSGQSIVAVMPSGGFDAIAIGALAGDTLTLSTLVTGSAPALARAIVPGRRRPRVVRSSPARGRTDVAINATVIVMFSEPIAPQLVDPEHIRLLKDGAAVAGSVKHLPGSVVGVEFVPAAPLERAASYVLVLGEDIVDLSGDPIEGDRTIDFRTAPDDADPPVGLSVVLNVASTIEAGSDLGAALTLTVSSGTGVPITNPSLPAYATITLASSPAGARLWGDTITVPRNGIYSFPGLWVDSQGGGYTLKATVWSGEQQAEVTSNVFTVTPPTHGVGDLSLVSFEVLEFEYPAGFWQYAPLVRVAESTGSGNAAVFLMEFDVPIPLADRSSTVRFCSNELTVVAGGSRDLVRELYGDWQVTMSGTSGERLPVSTVPGRIIFRVPGRIDTLLIEGPVVPGGLPATYTGGFGFVHSCMGGGPFVEFAR